MAKDVNLEAEEREDLAEETEGDRREFLKTAAMAAGAIAAAAALGDLAGDEADAQVRAAPLKAAALKSTAVRGAQLKMLKAENQKSLRLAGGQLAEVLKSEGMVGQDISDISKAAVTLSLSW